MKVVFCTPTRKRPHPAYLAALEASVPALDAAGIEHKATSQVAMPYISYAMAEMLNQAMQTDADAFVFIDDDESWRPSDLVTLIGTEGDVVAGTYRFKHDDDRVEYMGAWYTDQVGRPRQRASDGCIHASVAPTGFMKITRQAVRKCMAAHPELLFGFPEKPAIDLFNHGAIFGDGRWWGQDYAFCKRWEKLNGQVWLVPDLSINHHDWNSDRVWQGNLHEYLLRQPGGSEHRQAA